MYYMEKVFIDTNGLFALADTMELHRLYFKYFTQETPDRKDIHL